VNLSALPRVPTVNHGERRTLTDLLVWHCTAGGTARSSLEWIARPNSGAGYHYVIERDGTVFASTPAGRIAWHAGLSAWPVPVAGVPPRASVNGRSLGVAFANMNVGVDLPGHEPITEAQIVSTIALAQTLALSYPALRAITAHVRHRDVSPGRKSDPLPSVLEWQAFRVRLQRALSPDLTPRAA
jgi:N-acetylmuramoyl-L-alanine amidase